MPNEENLKKGEPYRFRTGEQQVETARKGGIASGEARRRKKAMRDTAKMLLDMQVPKAAKELKQKLAVMGGLYISNSGNGRRYQPGNEGQHKSRCVLA